MLYLCLQFTAIQYSSFLQMSDAARYGYISGPTEFKRAIKRYECPLGETCENIDKFEHYPASSYFIVTGIQPRNLNQQFGCSTQPNGTALLDLGLCRGPPDVSTEPPPYASFTSCIDDFDENEAESYVAYGTH